MVVLYDGRFDATPGVVDDVVGDDVVPEPVPVVAVELVVDGVVVVVPIVICACAAVTQDSKTQPTTGHQISCERRELIVMGACGHPGTGPMVG